MGMEHSQIISSWPSLKDFAQDVGVTYETAKAMKRRNSINSSYWSKLISAANARGYPIEWKYLADGAEKKISSKLPTG